VKPHLFWKVAIIRICLMATSRPLFPSAEPTDSDGEDTTVTENVLCGKFNTKR